MRDRQGVPPQAVDPPWEIGRPQDDVVRLAERGGFRGSVLEVACGSGENSLFLAARGLDVLGIDRDGAAIERARAKALQQGSKATFGVADALDLARLGRTFDTVLDCGFFHVLSDDERKKYARGLAAAVKQQGTLHILCFSEMEPGTQGPRRIRERELIDLFNMRGWLVEEVAEARFETTIHPEGARAWLATFTRVRT